MAFEKGDVFISRTKEGPAVSVGGVTAYNDIGVSTATSESDYEEGVMPLEEILSGLKGDLKFGDRKQSEALKAYQAFVIRSELVNGDYSAFFGR